MDECSQKCCCSQKSLARIHAIVKYRKKTLEWFLVYCFLGSYASKGWNMSESHIPSFIAKHHCPLFLVKFDMMKSNPCVPQANHKNALDCIIEDLSSTISSAGSATNLGND